MNQPEPESLVLGGNAPGPQSGSVVLGGTEATLGSLFERFNQEAKFCNGDYLRLEISERVALVRKRKHKAYDDIKLKYFVSKLLPTTFQNKPVTVKYWEFAGWLKHKGILFGPKAIYDPGKAVRETRRLVCAELLGHKL